MTKNQDEVSDYIAAVISQGTGILKVVVLDGEIILKSVKKVEIYKEIESD